MIRRFLIYIGYLILLLLSACDSSGTPMVTIEATAIQSSSVTVLPPVPSPTITIPTLEPTVQPEFLYAPDHGEAVYPLSNLRILSPGNGSKLTSPIQTELSVILGVNNTIQIELLNSIGELLVKKVIGFLNVGSNQRILIHPMMDFEIAGDQENGRLVLKTYDSFNRLIAMSSCDLTLLSAGSSEILPAAVPYEPFLITKPVNGEIIQGGVVTVAGYARPMSQSFVILELVDEMGVGVSNRQLVLKGESGGSPIVFSTTLPYVVFKATPVRLIIRQSKGQIPGPAFVSSLTLTIQ